MAGRRSLHRMSTRLYQQHRTTSSQQQLLSNRRLHFHQHTANSSTSSSSSAPVFSLEHSTPKNKLLALDISSRRDLHGLHTLGQPRQTLALPFLLRFPANHDSQQGGNYHRNFCSCQHSFKDNYFLRRRSPSFINTSPISYHYSTLLAAMSSPHLKTGSPCPPLQDGKVRIYNMKYCPFAQRALLAAEAKGISFDIVNCNLKDKPEWLLAKNPEGKVPVMETNDGKILYESLIVADYLDEAYPSQRPLHPKDAYKKAVDRLWVEKFSSVTSLFYKILFAIRDGEADSVKQERIANFVQGLKPFEQELERRGTVFFGGNDTPAMLDYMIWPWFERIPAVKSKLPDLFDYDAAKTENPNLEKWRQAMKNDAVVSKFLLPPDLHLRFMETFLAGSPNYDL